MLDLRFLGKAINEILEGIIAKFRGIPGAGQFDFIKLSSLYYYCLLGFMY